MTQPVGERPDSIGTNDATPRTKLSPIENGDLGGGQAPIVGATIEARLIAKANPADRMDFTGQHSLGQLTRAERRRVLFRK